jgi:adenine-specific DNA methylase
MGGGTTIIEALKLGCNVIGLDINPVAWFVSKKEAEPMDVGEINDAYEKLSKNIAPRIKKYYFTSCPNGHEAEVMYAFWIKKVKCSNCHSEIRLFPDYVLSVNRNRSTIICPACGEVFNDQLRSDEAAECPSCGNRFEPSKGVSERGTYVCPNCGKKESRLEATKRIGHRLDEDLFALEGYCKECGRFYKKADARDVLLFENAKSEFYRNQKNLLYPRQKIPVEGRCDPRPVNYGYKYFFDMFNERQLLCLSHLLSGIKNLNDITETTREFLLVAFSDCLAANNMFCIYETNWRKIGTAFGLRAFHPLERIAENNVWGTRFGRGTFTKCLQKLIKAKVSSGSVSDKTHTVQKAASKFIDILGEVSLISKFSECKGGRKAILKCQDSRSMSFIPSNSVDAVITDPPYFDNVMYSELADFFYVWLRLVLIEKYSWFKQQYSSRKEELVLKRDRRKRDTFSFVSNLQMIFAEANRILKDNGRLVFTFHHNEPWAWKNLAHSIINAGFNSIVAAHVVRSEGTTGFPTTKKNVKYDVCFVCKKSVGETSNGKEPVDLLLQHSLDCAKRIVTTGENISTAELYTIAYGQATKLWVSTARFYEKKLDNLYDSIPVIVNQIQKKLGLLK